MFDSTEFLEMLMWAIVPSALYAIALWLFDPRRPEILFMGLLFLIGAILVVPCYIAEYALDMAFPWWPVYFAAYILALLFFAREYICTYLGKINEA